MAEMRGQLSMLWPVDHVEVEPEELHIGSRSHAGRAEGESADAGADGFDHQAGLDAKSGVAEGRPGPSLNRIALECRVIEEL
ncbi:hypothetical protein [Bradyrhizobium sp. CB2312]|uniref:hypothetical protein n=1 Tax=Bradyrhizobium sp. CB2312 TaxID=3039155 RepID=UPI0024B2574D|nr:hypothetical protein [Bradyrhizobium sp. CB2312]WFU72269.1 hypothetical protein QA642_45225 [Bradyrhizobium sp. CB2312]